MIKLHFRVLLPRPPTTVSSETNLFINLLIQKLVIMAAMIGRQKL